jgi:hypothetical protein
MPGDKVGMKMGFEDMGDFYTRGLGGIKVDLDVATGINDGTVF